MGRIRSLIMFSSMKISFLLGVIRGYAVILILFGINFFGQQLYHLAHDFALTPTISYTSNSPFWIFPTYLRIPSATFFSSAVSTLLSVVSNSKVAGFPNSLRSADSV